MNLIVWLPTYPNVICDMLIALSKYFDGQKTIICPRPVSNADFNRYADTEIELYYKTQVADDVEEYAKAVEEICKQYPNAIHFFGGFFGLPGKALEIYSKQYNGKNAFIFTEKPSVRPTHKWNRMNKLIRTAYSSYIYFRIYLKFKKSIKAIFVTGEKGVKQLTSFRIPKEVLFEAMYTHNGDTPRVQKSVNGVLRFIYVGRFEYLTRGIDTLITACNMLEKGSWILDLVGGYGADAESVIDWCASRDNVSYIGEWKSEEVVEKLSDYDICISPTRIDGWRIQINQAIIAGIGTITTTEAISDELIEISNSGIVVPPNNPNALKWAMKYAILNPDMVYQWKRNAIKYRNKISNEAVGKYMYEVIHYCQTRQGDRPKCPWKE